ncbi:protein FAM110C [Cynocephalus volans]|uniref:protein FAM110C n=1 Tax=Cynocephalus volans TaxID=110931 RepID=UPI002FC9BDFE
MRALPALDLSGRLLSRDPEALRPPDAALRSAVERLAADRAKYVRGLPGGGGGPGATQGQEGGPGPAARRPIARKPLRPDSLLIYRQKCESVRGPSADGSRASLAKKLLPGPAKDKAPAIPVTPRAGGESPAGDGDPAGTQPGAAAPAPAEPTADPAAPAGSEPRVAARGGPRVAARGEPQRAQPDLGARHAKTSAESDAFFQFCGLEPDVLEALGRDNFAAGWDPVALQVRSVSVATSDSASSGHSGEERGLQAEELAEQVPSTTSVIERNARIIRWLYTCKKARETPGQALQGPA